MTDVFTMKPLDSYTDTDFEAVEAARLNAAMDARVTNADLLRAIAAIDAKVDAITEAVTYVVGIAEQVKDEAAPTIDAISSSPMFKMIVGKGGRKNG